METSSQIRNISCPPPPFRADLAREWMLREDITFLNHGSFGAVPRRVFEAQNEWRRRVEAEPIELLGRQALDLMEAAKEPVGKLLGMSTRDFGLVTNATEGVNAVLRSTRIAPGDELLTTGHVYNAVRKAMQYVAGQSGGSYREIDVPLPVASADEIFQLVVNGLRDNTRLLVIDHVTSPTALVFPVERIAAECGRRGIGILVDGAHAPGMLDLNVPKIGANYYAGNLHKWCCAPKGSGFLWVRPDQQKDIHPLVISHHLGEGFTKEFGWQGTRDVSAWLTIPATLQFMADLGWEKIRQHNHAMACWVHTMLLDRLKVPALSPVDGCLLGSMATVSLPAPLNALNDQEIQRIQQRMYREFKIEFPLMCWRGKSFLRVACAVYNLPEQFEKVAETIDRIAGRL